MLDDETKNRLELLELIDDLQKLGVSYHFEQETDNILTVFNRKSARNVCEWDNEKDLHPIALEFRLLRQHGFNVPEAIFDVIVEKIKGGTLESTDIKGFISLYEASYLSKKVDTQLYKIIRPFAIEQMKKFVDSNHNDDETHNIEMRERAVHALEMPCHWRMRRLETRWYIDTYEKKHDDMNLILMEFSEIDFNIVQVAHQEDLKHASSWWKETCLGNQLPFARDRIVENYFWNVGIIYEPQYGNIRRIMTIVALITTIDDIYDVYGTLEELEIFTAMVDDWDVKRLDELPEYMRLCFLVLYNEINGIGCDILKYKNLDVIPFLRKSAKWHKQEYKPSVEEYMENAWISISAPTILVHFYCVFSQQISIQDLETLSQNQNHLVRCSATILRLANDLATSPDEMARGDVLKSVQCYMHETGASEEKARAHVHQMISDTWDEMNYEAETALDSSSLSRGFVEAAMNLARMSQCMYQYGDGHGFPQKAKIVDHVLSLLVNPIPLN